MEMRVDRARHSRLRQAFNWYPETRPKSSASFDAAFTIASIAASPASTGPHRMKDPNADRDLVVIRHGSHLLSFEVSKISFMYQLRGPAV